MTSLGEALVSPGTGHERSFHCPVHGDNHPSASVNVITGLWICYTCGAKGKAGDGYTVDPTTLLTFLKQRKIKYETHYFPESWLNLFDTEIPEYWARRFSAEACEHFRLGFDWETESATYPLRDAGGSLLGVVRRPLSPVWDGGKYIYPRHIDVTKLLWNYSPEAHTQALLVEGAADAVACWDAGYEAFAVFGSRFTQDQAQLLRRTGVTEVFCCFDNDEAGRKAYSAARELVRDMRVHLIELGDYKDIAEVPLEDRRKLLASQLGNSDLKRVGSTTCESPRRAISTPLLETAGRPSSGTSQPGRLRIRRMS